MTHGPPYHRSMKTPQLPHGSMSAQPLYPLEACTGDEQLWLGDVHSLLDRGQKPSYTTISWQQQPDYLYETNLGTKRSSSSSSPTQTLHLMNLSGVDTAASFPLATDHRMVSPAPSQELSTPTSSNARSPATEPEWYPDVYNTPLIYDDLVFPTDIPYLAQESSTDCAQRPDTSLFPGSIGFPCVNMSQVQGFIDPQDYAEPHEDDFEPGERYLELDQAEHCIEVDAYPIKDSEVRAPDRYSFISNERPEITKDVRYVQEQNQLQAEDDMDIDHEDGDETIEDEVSDTDYIPRATRPTRRRTVNSKSLPPSSAKSRRVTKSKAMRPTKSSKIQSGNACRNCRATFIDTAVLQHHVESSHLRAFTCIFNFAGCPSTFASKNEWKRHVSTQHMCFHSWVCDLDSCEKTPNDSSSSPGNTGVGQPSRGATFNRKDLFTQHLRRMHMGQKSKNKQKSAGSEGRIKELQNSCKQVNRQGPQALRCPVVECGDNFSGPKCWNACMEHVARHLEKSASTKGSPGVQHEDDELLVTWALNEGIIECVPDGGYKLIPIASWLDQDAEGEDEF